MTPPQIPNPLLVVKDVQCGYAGQTIVDGLSFHINKGDICALLGSSGCGKTTTLRAIAGFEPVSNGSITVNNTVLSSPDACTPPEQRQLGMVFQDYALFPHLSVLDNVAFGLKSHSDKNAESHRLLDLVGLKGMGTRYPHELSGGQQQRVALARALAPKPRLLLMDEPFSNLDVDLRRRLSREVREILKQLGISAILVTHDQEEAFAFADKIGVVKDGRLEQWDTPWQLYHEPATPYVARFIGQGSFIPGQATSHESIQTELGEILGNRAYQWTEGTPIEVLLRPDDLGYKENSPVKGTVVRKTFMGATTRYQLKLRSGAFVDCLVSSHRDFNEGDDMAIQIIAEHLIAFEAPHSAQQA